MIEWITVITMMCGVKHQGSQHLINRCDIESFRCVYEIRDKYAYPEGFNYPWAIKLCVRTKG